MTSKLTETRILLPKNPNYVPTVTVIKEQMSALTHLEMHQIISNLTHCSQLSSTQKQNGLDLLSKLSHLKGMLWCLAEIFLLWQKHVKVKLGFNKTTGRNNTGKKHLNIMD